MKVLTLHLAPSEAKQPWCRQRPSAALGVASPMGGTVNLLAVPVRQDGPDNRPKLVRAQGWRA